MADIERTPEQIRDTKDLLNKSASQMREEAGDVTRIWIVNY